MGWGLRHDGGYDGEEYEGLRRATCSFFLEKKKEPKKNRSGFLPIGLRVFALWGTVSLYGRRRIYSDLSYLVRYEPAALTYALLCRSPCTVILGVSGYRAPGFGLLRLFAPAMCSPLRRLRWLFGALPALCHKSKPSAGNARLPPSGCIRGFTLAAPAINQSGRGSYAVVSALLYSRFTRPESSVSLRAAICGAAAAAFFYARRYAARSHRS